MSAFFPANTVPEVELTTGVTARILSGDRLMLCEIAIEVGGVIPRHEHPHEQAGRCLEGSFELEIDGVAQIVQRGDSYLIPGGRPHSARSLGERAVTLDVFSPPREEYRALATSSQESNGEREGESK